MTARVLTGSKLEIAQKLAQIEGNIHEAIVFIDEPSATESPNDVFAEMEPFTVQQATADDSRDALYQRLEGE